MPRLSADIRRERLLDGATRLFAQKGFEGTTTKEIANKAGVSEAIVFRHFRNKEELYWAVIEKQCRINDASPTVKRLLDQDSAANDFAVFSSIGEDILRRNMRHSQLSRLLLFSALENHKLTNRFFRNYINEYYEAVASRIRDRTKRGRFKEIDSLLAARSFIGMFFYHYLIQELFGGKKFHRFDVQDVSRSLTEVWLSGMQNARTRTPSKSLRKAVR